MNLSRIIISDTVSKSKNAVCNLDSINLFYFVFLPIIILLILVLLIIYKDYFKNMLLNYMGKLGKVIIWMILPNKHIKQKYITLDKYNNFNFGNKKFNLEDLEDYIIGYKNNMPVFMFDSRFILPLKMTERDINKQIRKSLGIVDKPTEQEEVKIRQLYLKINPNILDTVYTKKLISDLYAISSGELDFKKMIFWVIVGSIGFAIAYYMGWIDIILEYFK